MVFITGVDQRKKIVPFNLYTFPNHCIGYIKSCQDDKLNHDDDTGCKFGTGFLISNCLVLTSANQFIKQQNGKLSQLIPLYFAIQQRNNQGGNIIKKYKIEKVKINPQYIQLSKDLISIMESLSEEKGKQIKIQIRQQMKAFYSEISQKDYCLLKLSHKIQRQRYFSLCPNLTKQSAQLNLTVSGYQNSQLFSHSSSILSINKGTISYEIDTAGGQGGSPVYFTDKDNKVVGIHKGYSNQQRGNFGTLITDQTIDVLQKWCFEMKCSFLDISTSYSGKNKSKLKENHLRDVETKATNIYPQNSIGRLVNKRSKKVIGTGFLISNGFILAYASMVYPNIKNNKIQQLSFILFGSKKFIQIKDYRINPKFQEIYRKIQILRKKKQQLNNSSEKKKKQIEIHLLLRESQKYDFCLLKMEEELNNSKYFKFFPNVPPSLEWQLEVTGYSNKYDCGDNYFTNAGKIKDVIDQNIYYNIDTVEGQIGCPVYFQDNGFCVIGIHKGFSNEDNSSYGTIITSEVISVLQEWCLQMSPQFTVLDLKMQ